MNILHYSLGIYPERQGGLVRYSTDLALEQSLENEVYYLVPGKLGIVDKRIKVIEALKKGNLRFYRINNALPIPVYSGIKDIKRYIHSAPINEYEKFLEEHSISILFVHTLMGLHLELLEAAEHLGVRVIMIVHDFFGLCPITTLLRNGIICENEKIDANCYECSYYAHSYMKLAIGQSKVYKCLKRWEKISKIRNAALRQLNVEKQSIPIPSKIEKDYQILNDYYVSCFNHVNYFIYNSSQTQEVFVNRLGNKPGQVINLLHKGIRDSRKKRTFLMDDILRIGFMGESTVFKGFEVIRTAVLELYNEGYKVELEVFNDSVDESECIKRKGHYKYTDLEKIYNTLDLIAIPSICYETLSFVAVEALSMGMPCIVSSHVGAKDLIEDKKTGFIVRAGDKEHIRKVLRDILENRRVLGEINNNILNTQLLFDFKQHCKDVTDMAQKLL